LSETGSRPAFLDEFERKLAAALARQPDARKTRIASVPTADASVAVPSSPSLEAITPGSKSEEPPAKVEQPSSETGETRTQLSNPKPRRLLPQGDRANDAAKALAASGTVRAAQPAARSDLAEIPSAARAFESAVQPGDSAIVQTVANEAMTAEASIAVVPALPPGSGNEPTQEIGAAPGPVDSKAQQTVDVEAMLADVEGSPADDAEVAKAVKPPSFHARSTAEVTKRPSRNWKLMAWGCALVGVAMVGAVALPRSMLALPTLLRADRPSARETLIRNDKAEQALEDPALEASTAAKNRLGANSEAGVTNVALQPKDTPGAGAIQLTIEQASNLTAPNFPPAPPIQPSGVEPTPTDLPATATSTAARPAQSSELKLAPTDLAAAATSTAAPPAQPSDLNLVPADLAATPPSSVAPPVQPSGIEPVPTDRAAIATPPLARPAQTSDVKEAPALSPRPAPIPTTATLPIGASPADHATKPTAAKGPSPSAPAAGMKRGVASNVAQPGGEPPAADPAASAQDGAIKKPGQPLPVGHDRRGRKPRGAQTAPSSAATATPAAPIQLNGLY
jgi:hypothetical protein